MEKNHIKKLKIAVLGAGGQMGQEFRYLAPSYEYCTFYFFDRKKADISDSQSIKNIIDTIKPDYLINCAAYTAVDKAETETKLCYEINTVSCKIITDAIKESQTKLVHFSTDYVYHIYHGFPLSETDETTPKSTYAKSKLEGEKIIRNAGVPALILRTSWVISSFGHNFAKTMMTLGKEKSTLNVVCDQYGAPTYARHLATSVLDIITLVEAQPEFLPSFNDTYNYANEGIITWYDIASQIMKEKNLSCTIRPIQTSGYPTAAVRPKWSVLSKHKIKEKFNLEIPHWYQALKECLEAIENE